MSSVRRIRFAGRLTTVALLMTAACVSSGRSNDPAARYAMLLDSLGRDTASLEGPGVSLSTDTDYGRYSSVSARLYLEDDAYVAVVNVSPTGYAQVVFPDDPASDGFLQGGKVYRVPSYFTGYRHTAWEPPGAAGTRYVWYGRSSNARVGARGPGYMFAIASRTPLDLQALAREGYFDEVRAGETVHEMDPSSVIPRVALIAAGPTGGVTFDHARYSGYDPLAYVSSMFADGLTGGYCDATDAAFGLISRASWDLTYGSVGCNLGDLRRWRARNELLTPRLPRPTWPTVPRDTTAADSSASPRTKPKPDTASAPTRVATQPGESPREQFIRLREQLRAAPSDEELLLVGGRSRPGLDAPGRDGEDGTSAGLARQTRARAIASPELRPERRSEPRTDSPEPRAKSRPEPRAESRPEPRAEPRVESRPEPRAEPRVESRPAPRIERPVPVERPTPEPGSR